MTDFILFLLATIGLTNILVDGKIAQPIRDFLKEPPNWVPFKAWTCTPIYEMLSCHMCCGTWVGVLCGCLIYDDFAHILLCGFAGSFAAMFSAMIMNLIEAKTIVTLENDD